MTDQQDLSLLTDEERELYDAAKLVDDYAAVRLAEALIAARAENKRLLDGLVDMLPLAKLGIVASERAGSNEHSAKNLWTQHKSASEAASQALRAARALLQSEKGGAE